MITTKPALALPADVSETPEWWLALHDDDPDWCYSIKVDGIRCLADHGRLITRGGVDVTARFPEVVVPDDVVIDGELAVVDAEGQADFEATSRKAAGGHGGHAVLFAFDLLEADDWDWRTQRTYADRYRRLAEIEGVTFLTQVVGPGSGQRLFDIAVEGIVARRRSGAYVPGRLPNLMVRLKKRSTREAIVVGRTPGRGGRADTFGALQLAVLDDAATSGVRHVGDVGSGFSTRDLVDVMEALATGDPFVIEVESLGLTSTGKLRQPSFIRLRPDVDVLDVRWDQP